MIMIRFLRTEQIGGLILLAATVLALMVANSPLAGSYHTLAGYELGGLTVESWAKDGLLSIFFVVAGLELKRELVVGELRNPRQAALPIIAAIGGMIVPALVCLAVAWGAPGASDAWPVPVATDIAFALAVLAITARDLPSSLRLFLLSLAIVDDLGAIILIAVLFSSPIHFGPLLAAVAVVGLYAGLQYTRVKAWWVYVPLAVLAWILVHESGVHATIAGVAIGLATRATYTARLEHVLQPISAGICVPLFAFFAAGVPINASAMAALFTDRAALGIIAGLVIGKTIGVFGTAFATASSPLARLPAGLRWRDLFAVSVLTGCGFTVSLLIAELGFPGGTQQDSAKAAVLLGSTIASLLAAALLRRRVRAHNS